MIEIAKEIQAIQREVGEGKLKENDARVVRLSRTYTSEIDDVWDALTNPDRIGRWFLPISGDFRLGGRYQFEGNAGGDIVSCERPNRLLVTWAYGMENAGDASEVELRLSPVNTDSTTVELIHTAVVPAEMWDQYGPGAVGVGWEGGFLGLELHLRGQSIGDSEAWQLSDEGREFYRLSSQAWGTASSADGVDAATVARYVANTIEFYAPSTPPA